MKEGQRQDSETIPEVTEAGGSTGSKQGPWSTVREGNARWGGVRASAVVCERQRKRNENFVWKLKMKKLLNLFYIKISFWKEI